MATRRVLVIDDEDDIREVAKLCLETVGGWDVCTAPSGAAGIVEARRLQPDAILLDVMMPEMDGPSTLQKLQNDPETKNIPVVFLTAKIQAADQRRYGSLGVAGVLAKPFDPLGLANELAGCLGWETL